MEFPNVSRIGPDNMSIFLLLLAVTVFRVINSYNVEVKKVGVATGDAGTQFGYTVTIVTKLDDETV